MRTLGRMGSSVTSVDDVIVAPVPVTAADKRREEVDAFLHLSETLANCPSDALQHLVETALTLTHSHSAGVSLEDEEGGEPVFRWIAATGVMAPYLNGTMPRHFSPCGTAVDRGTSLVMSEPARHFRYVADLPVSIRAALLVPLSRQGRYVGTVWVLAHDAGKAFTTEDVRVVEQLTTFSGAVLDAWRARLAKA